MVKFYDPNEETVNKEFEDDDYGNYVVGHKDKNSKFIPTYVGKGILKNRLTEHLTDEYYDDLFTYEEQKTEVAACKEECDDYHDFKPISEGGTLKNKNHPPVPKGEKCHRCGHKGS